MSLFSNTYMLAFTLLAIVLTAVAAALIIKPLLSRKHLPKDVQFGDAHTSATLIVLQEQYAELEQHYRNGAIDQAQWQQTQEEIERRALSESATLPSPILGRPEKLWAASSTLFIAVFAMAGYLLLGEPAAVIPDNTVAASSTNDAHALSDMVQALEQRLQDSSGGTPQDWTMLARSYLVLQEYEKASQAYAQLLTFDPQNPDVLASHAEALLLAADGITPKAIVQLEHALQQSPLHPHALFLSGSVAFQQSDYKQAVNYWTTLLGNMDADDPDMSYRQALIDDATARAIDDANPE